MSQEQNNSRFNLDTLMEIFSEGSEARRVFGKYYAILAIIVILSVLALLALATQS